MRHIQSFASPLSVVASLLLFGCSSDNHEPETSHFTLTGSSIEEGKPLPSQFTCNDKAFGAGSSPELKWSGAFNSAKSYAIVLKDLTIEQHFSNADNNPEHAYHWAIWNIPSSVRSLPASLANDKNPASVPGAQQQNGGPPFIEPGSYGYFGPCPNLGAAGLGASKVTDLYEFVIYAFSEATLTPPEYNAGTDPANPLNPVRQLYAFFDINPSLVDIAAFASTSDATPATCPGFANPPFTCAPASP